MGRGRKAILMQWHYFLHNTQRDKNNKNHSKPTKNKLHNLNGLFEGQKRICGVMTILMGWNMIGHMISGFAPGTLIIQQFLDQYDWDSLNTSTMKLWWKQYQQINK